MLKTTSFYLILHNSSFQVQLLPLKTTFINLAHTTVHKLYLLNINFSGYKLSLCFIKCLENISLEGMMKIDFYQLLLSPQPAYI